MSTTISCEQNNDVDDSDLQITITNVPPPDDDERDKGKSISLWRRFLQGKPPSDDVDPRDWPPTKKYAIILIVALSAFTYDILPHMFILVIDLLLLLLLVHLVLQPSMCVIVVVMFIGRSRIINHVS